MTGGEPYWEHFSRFNISVPWMILQTSSTEKKHKNCPVVSVDTFTARESKPKQKKRQKWMCMVERYKYCNFVVNFTTDTKKYAGQVQVI
uniref:Uncharacterized protein n=1 Tax=Arion vulgaris TaxID=1028688 RepID=A0A0B7B1S8_9EUPU